MDAARDAIIRLSSITPMSAPVDSPSPHVHHTAAWSRLLSGRRTLYDRHCRLPLLGLELGHADLPVLVDGRMVDFRQEEHARRFERKLWREIELDPEQAVGVRGKSLGARGKSIGTPCEETRASLVLRRRAAPHRCKQQLPLQYILLVHIDTLHARRACRLDCCAFLSSPCRDQRRTAPDGDRTRPTDLGQASSSHDVSLVCGMMRDTETTRLSRSLSSRLRSTETAITAWKTTLEAAFLSEPGCSAIVEDQVSICTTES
jgi:hypothetical protein